MAQDNDTTKLAEMLQLFAESENPLLQMLQKTCEMAMEIEVNQKLQAEKSERTEERLGYRSGYRRNRRLDTRLGTMSLSIPKFRKGGYVPFFLKKWQRSEQALILTIQEIYLQGVSTRKVKKIAESMGIENISAAEVSIMSKGLDEQVKSFRNKDLSEKQYPILWVDALYEDVRIDGQVVSTAVEVVVGVDEDGKRNILAIELMAEESADSYKVLFQSLKYRGLKGVKLVISDAHSGLHAAIKESFTGASWQRCKVHFMRNILAKVPKKSKEETAADLKQIWLAKTKEAAQHKAQEFIDKYEKRFPEAVKCLEDGLESSLSFYDFPSIDSRKISSSNMIERLNEEIRRRTRVVGIFPSKESYIRLVTSYMLEYAEDWSSDRCYIQPKAIREIIEKNMEDGDVA